MPSVAWLRRAANPATAHADVHRTNPARQLGQVVEPRDQSLGVQPELVGQGRIGSGDPHDGTANVDPLALGCQALTENFSESLPDAVFRQQPGTPLLGEDAQQHLAQFVHSPSQPFTTPRSMHITLELSITPTGKGSASTEVMIT